MSLAKYLKASKLSEGEPTNTAGGSPPGTLLSDMAGAGLNIGQLGGAMLMMAGGRNAQNMRLGNGALSNEQMIQGHRQGLNPRDMGGASWEGGKWMHGGAPYVSPGNQFNYGRGQGTPRTGRSASAAGLPPPAMAAGNKELLPGGSIPRGTPPPAGTAPVPPPVGSRPRTPTSESPPVAPPPTTVPGGTLPTSGPYTGDNSTIQPGMTPRPSFDPTQLLLALRQSTQGGALKGPNAVQGNLASWLAQAMKMPAGSAQPTGQATRG